MTRVSRPVRLDDEAVYRTLGVRWYGAGCFLKAPLEGRKIAARSMFAVKPGDVVFSRLFAWKGSFGIVMAEHAGAVASNEFPMYRTGSDLLPEYFELWARREEVWVEAESASTGTTANSRNRLSEDAFLDMTIDLPQVGEQARCVEVARRSKTAVQSLVNERVSLVALRQALIEHEILRVRSRTARISDLVASIKSGTSLRCHSQPAGVGQSGVLKLSAVQSGRFIPTATKLVPADTRIPRSAVLEGGEILVTRSNTLDRVGYACLVEDLDDRSLVCPDLVYRLTGISDAVSREFLTIALGLRAIRQQMKDAAVGTSDSMKKISIASLRELEIPVPSLQDQLTLTGRVRELDQAADALEHSYESAAALRKSLCWGLLDGTLEPPPVDALTEAA
jgi:type I restriction enzyme S subunit